jgi:hypothetical protein
MNIIKGKQAAPVKAVVYGPEGVGKSTFAAAWPNPVFLDIEGGTKQLDVSRVEPMTTAEDVRKAIAQLAIDPHDFRTVVIDTADWLERRVTEDVCRKAKVDGIEAFGYGKGYTVLADAMAQILASLNALQAKRGMHVVLLAHAAVKRCDPPTETGQPYDRFELKCTKQVSPLLKEWCDLLLFLNFRTMVQEGAGGRSKGIGGRERVMYTAHHAAYDAKNRFGLADELPVDVASLAPVFAGVSAPVAAPVVAAPPLTWLDEVEEAAKAGGVTPDQVIGFLVSSQRLPAPVATLGEIPPHLLSAMAKPENVAKWIAGAKGVNA